MSGRRRNGKVGIALAGGGPLGGIYEIGALVALEEALKGVDAGAMSIVYVGVSSGAFVAAGLANGIAPREMHAMFILERSHRDPFEPDLLLRPAFGEFLRRLMRCRTDAERPPSPISERRPGAASSNSFMRLTRGCRTASSTMTRSPPTCRGSSASQGEPTIFASSGAKLFVVATELDSGKSAPFGAPGFDHVPISRRSRRAPLCRASIRRRGSKGAIMSTAR